MTRFIFAILAISAALAQPPMRTGDGVWLRDPLFGERDTFDACLAHQPGQGQYHNHVQPVCLRAQLDDNLELVANGRTGATYREKSSGWKHSPILGWALDGYPIRELVPHWAVPYHPGVPQQLPAAQQGPPVNDRFPVGRYIEDHEYISGLGDLDQYNGRTAVTPEYPNGTYA